MYIISTLSSTSSHILPLSRIYGFFSNCFCYWLLGEEGLVKILPSMLAGEQSGHYTSLIKVTTLLRFHGFTFIIISGRHCWYVSYVSNSYSPFAPISCNSLSLGCRSFAVDDYIRTLHMHFYSVL